MGPRRRPLSDAQRREVEHVLALQAPELARFRATPVRRTALIAVCVVPMTALFGLLTVGLGASWVLAVILAVLMAAIGMALTLLQLTHPRRAAELAVRAGFPADPAAGDTRWPGWPGAQQWADADEARRRRNHDWD
jgi:hypothetical protein